MNEKVLDFLNWAKNNDTLVLTIITIIAGAILTSISSKITLQSLVLLCLILIFFALVIFGISHGKKELYYVYGIILIFLVLGLFGLIFTNQLFVPDKETGPATIYVIQKLDSVDNSGGGVHNEPTLNLPIGDIDPIGEVLSSAFLMISIYAFLMKYLKKRD